MAPRRKRSEHYVNNKEFLAALIAYRQRIAIAETKGEPKPRITNYLGSCFSKQRHFYLKSRILMISQH